MTNLKKKRMGKKGAILDFGGLAQTVTAIFDLIPKPIKFILFFVLIIFFMNIIQSMFGLFGLFCSSGDIPMTTGGNIFKNIDLVQKMPDPTLINLNGVTIDDNFRTEQCSIYLKSGDIVYPDNSVTHFSSGRWFYRGTACSRCDKIKVFNYTSEQSTILDNPSPQDGLCEEDVYYNYNLSWFSKIRCTRSFLGLSDYELCLPPKGYYFDSDTNIYLCDSFKNDCVNGSKKNTIGQKWDDDLIEKGAVPLYPSGVDSSDTSDKSFIGIKCVDVRPKLALFRQIEIFDYRLWIMILLLIFVFLLYKMAKG